MTRAVVENRTQLSALTSLRFFAALLVFCWHAGWTKGFAELHFLGPCGVEFFFVLSGFILSYTYARAFAHGRPWSAVRAFWIARFARIYPLYVLSLAAAVVIGQSGRLDDAIPPHGFWPILFAHVALIQTWDLAHMGVAFRFSRVDWSISDEAFFYAAFPLLAPLLLGGAMTVRRLLLYAVGLGALAVIITVVIWPYVDERIPYVFPPVRMFDFAVGMLLGTAFVRGLRVPDAAGTATSLEILALGVWAGALAALPRFGTSTAIGPYFLPWSGAIIAIFACGAGAVSRALSARWLVYLGEISFALYLVHILVLAFVPSASALQFALALGLSVAVAAAAHELFEKPLRDGIRARFARA